MGPTYLTDRQKGIVEGVSDKARAAGRQVLTAPEGRLIAEAYGIPVPAEGLAEDAEDAEDAVALADRIGFPVALKIVSPDIPHKTDAGGVRTGLGSAAEVRAAFTTIVANARAYAPQARIDGVQVQQMVPEGQEVIVGAVTDPTFGKVVAFRLGGVLVEVLKDVTFRLAPASGEEAGRKGVPNAVLIPSGFAETGEHALQQRIVAIGAEWGIRLLGPNIYGYYSTWQDLCATFCTPYDVKGGVALTSQSGGIGMAILGFARTTRTGVSAIVGLGNKADVDEDDLLTYFAEAPHTDCIAMHLEDLKDGRAFVAAARETVPKKPVVVLKAGRTSAGARAAGSHTGALAGDDAVYDDILRQAG
ncbi:hypothetical protein GCM10010341_49990 [Streptomyces noursei]|nr:hypothetical protein GCM10010341_49990 [Streptomyces noursei]